MKLSKEQAREITNAIIRIGEASIPKEASSSMVGALKAFAGLVAVRLEQEFTRE